MNLYDQYLNDFLYYQWYWVFSIVPIVLFLSVILVKYSDIYYRRRCINKIRFRSRLDDVFSGYRYHGRPLSRFSSELFELYVEANKNNYTSYMKIICLTQRAIEDYCEDRMNTEQLTWKVWALNSKIYDEKIY